MDKIIDKRTIRVRYGTEEKYLKDYAHFGWSLSSKNLLNRFGNPLPLDEKVSESDKREKCFYDLYLVRELESDKIKKLDNLQNEYDSYEPIQTCFSGQRVTGSVFLTIGAIIFGIFASVYGYIYYLIPFILFLMGLLAVIITGIFHVISSCKRSDSNEARKKQILEDAKKILSE